MKAQVVVEQTHTRKIGQIHSRIHKVQQRPKRVVRVNRALLPQAMVNQMQKHVLINRVQRKMIE